MSIQITTAFVQQYSANIQMLSQQMGSLLRDKVRVESVVGKNAFFDQVGSVTAVLKTSRHSDTPQIDTPHSRRRVSLADYEFADLIDQQDKVRLLIDPSLTDFKCKRRLSILMENFSDYFKLTIIMETKTCRYK